MTIMKSINAKRGFTLIELLVVISIIGMLASVVLVSLSSARNKAKDSSAIQSLVAIRSQAELVMTPNGYPSNLCEAGGPLLSLLYAVKKQVGPTTPVSCITNPPNPGVYKTAWAVSTTLNSGSTYCVDSMGYSGVGTAGGTAVCSGGVAGPGPGAGSPSIAISGVLSNASFEYIAYFSVNNFSGQLYYTVTNDDFGEIDSGTVDSSVGEINLGRMSEIGLSGSNTIDICTSGGTVACFSRTFLVD